MRAMVMPLWSCGYTVMLTSLRESFMGGRGERNGEERERERDNRQKSTSGEYCGHSFHFSFKQKRLTCVL